MTGVIHPLCKPTDVAERKSNALVTQTSDAAVHTGLQILSNLVQLLVLAERGQGQGGTSSSNGNTDATFMLLNGDGSRSCIPSGLYSSFPIL